MTLLNPWIKKAIGNIQQEVNGHKSDAVSTQSERNKGKLGGLVWFNL